MLLIGLFIAISASVSFGLLVYVDDDKTFYYMGMTIKFFQGAGDALI